MNSDESSRGMSNHYARKPMPTKYSDKNHTFGPGQNYSYGNQPYNGNSHYNGGSNFYNNGHNGPQNQRRRPDRFKRDNYNYNERLIKQNDIIIRLLKEIRDRLPAPAQSEENQYYDDEQEQRIEPQESSSQDNEISDEDEEVLMEPASEEFVSEQDHFNEEER